MLERSTTDFNATSAPSPRDIEPMGPQTTSRDSGATLFSSLRLFSLIACLQHALDDCASKPIWWQVLQIWRVANEGSDVIRFRVLSFGDRGQHADGDSEGRGARHSAHKLSTGKNGVQWYKSRMTFDFNTERFERSRWSILNTLL